MRIPLLAANWKMHKTPAEARSFVVTFLETALPTNAEVAIFPPAIDIPATIDAAKGSALRVGAQNMYFADEGAFTGEISAPMLVAAGATHVLIGHSERRQYFGETEETAFKKLCAALKAGLKPIYCVGEQLDDREAGKTHEVLGRQFRECAGRLDHDQFQGISIAYEPCWAIGTGKVATPEMAAAAHAFIREQIEETFGAPAAAACRILYGGSVKPDNIGGLMAQDQIDGALVGGASLDPISFAAIVNF